MTNRKEASSKQQNSHAFGAPRWMTRLEKADFRRVLDAREAASKPVLASEFDTLCDYVTCRSRIRSLQKMTRAAVAEATKKDSFRSSPYPPDQKHAALVVRQLDSTVSLSRRLARDLQLVGDA